MVKNIFSCFIVGDDNLTLQCAEILLVANHQILGLISPSEHIKKWCITQSIPYINDIDEFDNAQPFDFLFSIVNGQILPQHILKSPRYCAINYHNSPLPKYAGLYATSWAILNSETHHAVSWHVMEDIVDAGAILKQSTFPIEEADTALSLNLKCYEHAIGSFQQLIDFLATGTIVPIQQDLTVRSYYGLKDKPEHFGFIAWNQSAEQIDKLLRALTFGKYINQLATPKIIIGNHIFVVKSYKKLNTFSGLKPGSIIENFNECLQIATKTSDIAILKLTDLSGQEQSIDALVLRFKLEINATLDSINDDFVERLRLSPVHNPKAEQFWVKEFLDSVPETTFLSRLPKSNNSMSDDKKVTFIPNALLKRINRFSNELNTEKNFLLTAILVYLYRLNNYKKLSVAYSYDELRDTCSGLNQFLSEYVPLTAEFDGDITFSQAFQVVASNSAELYKNKTFAKDIFIRYPELGSSHAMEISIVFIDEVHPVTNNSDTPLSFYCLENGSGFYVHYNLETPSSISSYAFLENINGHILTLLDDAINNPTKKLFELTFLDTKEKNNLLVSWNNTQVTFDEEKPLHHYFEEQVLKTPHAIAAVFENSFLTYEELNQKANILAHCMRKQGIQPNHLVGIYLNRGLEMVIGILGVLKSGGAYLPLDPNYPDDRIAYMIHDSQCRLLLTAGEGIRSKFSEHDAAILDIGQILHEYQVVQEM